MAARSTRRTGNRSKHHHLPPRIALNPPRTAPLGQCDTESCPALIITLTLNSHMFFSSLRYSDVFSTLALHSLQSPYLPTKYVCGCGHAGRVVGRRTINPSHCAFTYFRRASRRRTAFIAARAGGRGWAGVGAVVVGQGARKGLLRFHPPLPIFSLSFPRRGDGDDAAHPPIPIACNPCRSHGLGGWDCM